MSNSLQYHIVSTVRNVGDIFILGLLGLFTMSGKLTVGEMVKSYMYVSYIFAPTSYIMGLKSQLYNTSAALERLDDIFRTTTEEELDKKKKNLPSTIDTIEFENVSFRYGMRPRTLNNINFKIEKGDSVGIIGESGCGKTTMIKLILGFFPVNSGVLKINERNFFSIR